MSIVEIQLGDHTMMYGEVCTNYNFTTYHSHNHKQND